MIFRFINRILSLTGYQLVHHENITSRKEVVMTYFYGVDKDEVVYIKSGR